MLAHPAGLDRTGQLFELRVGWQVAEVVFAFSRGAMLANHLYLLPGRFCWPRWPMRCGGPSATRTRMAANIAESSPSVPRRQPTVCHFALSSTSWTGREGRSGTWFLRGRLQPVSQLVFVPKDDAYCGTTPTEAGPFLSKAVSSIISHASLLTTRA